MTHLELNELSKSYPRGVQAVEKFNLAVKKGDFVVLVGPSGCGKTTVLRMIAGLEDSDTGSLVLDGIDISAWAPKERGVGMIFQDYALYPHLTVRQNIAFPLEMHHYPKAEIATMVDEMAQNLQIKEILDRKPGALSGGQRQRVAIARALVRKPKICLMDEPFSNLDAQLRVQMRGELARIHREHNMTIVFVTHDQIEAMALGSRIVVMRDGIIQQAATSQELYTHPANLFVAQFFGTPPMNTFPATLHHEDGSWHLRFGESQESFDDCMIVNLALNYTHATSLDANLDGASVVLGIRPEHIKIASKSEDGALSFNAYIERIEELGSENYLYASFMCAPLVVCTSQLVRFSVGSLVRLSFNPSDCFFFDAETGTNVLDGRE